MTTFAEEQHANALDLLNKIRRLRVNAGASPVAVGLTRDEMGTLIAALDARRAQFLVEINDEAAAAGWGKYPDPVRAEREAMRQYAGTYDTKPLNPSKVVSRVREGMLDETDPRALVTEASEMDLAPGVWPDEVQAIRPDGSIDRYRFTNRIEENGEIQAMVYTRADGTELHVLND